MENMKEKMSAFATHLAESLPNDYGIDLFDVAVNHFQWSFPTLNKKYKKDSTIKCPSIVHYFDDAFNKKAIGQVNQKIIFARLAISQGYRQKIDPYVPEEIAYFSRQWAGTHRVNVVNYVNFLTKVQPCIDNLNIEEILHILANEAKGLDHIAS